MNKVIKAKLDEIAQYAKIDSNGIDELTVFGEALTENSKTAWIRLAAMFNEELDIDASFEGLATKVDEVADGRFELLIMNGDNLTSNTMLEIERGEVIYNSKNKT